MPSKCKLVKTDFTTPYTRNNHPFVEKKTVPSVRSVRFHSIFHDIALLFHYQQWYRHVVLPLCQLCVNSIIADPWKSVGCKSITKFTTSNDHRKRWIDPMEGPSTGIKIKEKFRYRRLSDESKHSWIFYLYTVKSIRIFVTEKLLKCSLVI